MISGRASNQQKLDFKQLFLMFSGYFLMSDSSVSEIDDLFRLLNPMVK